MRYCYFSILFVCVKIPLLYFPIVVHVATFYWTTLLTQHVQRPVKCFKNK